MTMDYQALMARRREGQLHEYDSDRVMLYGVGVGLGWDPMDRSQLRFVAERDLVPLPSFVTVAVWDIGFLLEVGVEWSKLLHAAQKITFHHPLPTAGKVRASRAVKAAYDKPGRGTLLIDETQVFDEHGETLLATLEATSFLRDFHIPNAPEGGPAPFPEAPARDPDLLEVLETSPQAALVYRLLGGRSDIHWDPEDAAKQGFERPIMHGLCTYGYACHAVLRGVCDYEPRRLREFSARFSAPVFPGERLATRFWRDRANVWFETRAVERDIVVLANGFARLAD